MKFGLTRLGYCSLLAETSTDLVQYGTLHISVLSTRCELVRSDRFDISYRSVSLMRSSLGFRVFDPVFYYDPKAKSGSVPYYETLS